MVGRLRLKWNRSQIRLDFSIVGNKTVDILEMIFKYFITSFKLGNTVKLKNQESELCNTGHLRRIELDFCSSFLCIVKIISATVHQFVAIYGECFAMFCFIVLQQ